MDIKELECEVFVKNKEIFSAYRNFLVSENQKYNLTSITDENEVFVKHFCDSVSSEKFLPKNAHMLDIGAGAGFPSLPLKIVRPDLKVSLIESNNKKFIFLNAVVEKLGLCGVQSYCVRAETAAHEDFHREKYDVVVARAVAPMNSLCELTMPFVSVGGKFIAYKGGCVEEELDEARNAVKILGGRVSAVEPYSLPDGFGERTLIIVDKISPAPTKYPRGHAKERKNPL